MEMSFSTFPAPERPPCQLACNASSQQALILLEAAQDPLGYCCTSAHEVEAGAVSSEGREAEHRGPLQGGQCACKAGGGHASTDGF